MIGLPPPRFRDENRQERRSNRRSTKPQPPSQFSLAAEIDSLATEKGNPLHVFAQKASPWPRPFEQLFRLFFMSRLTSAVASSRACSDLRVTPISRRLVDV